MEVKSLANSGESSQNKRSGKLFFLGESHSRNSSFGSMAGDEAEASVELLPDSGKGVEASSKEASDYSANSGENSKKCCKVTGSCMCKLSVLFYLAACILVSALYVAFFGKNQAIFGDAWIPGKPTVHDKPTPQPYVYFEDLPYTEWRSQRWTYHDQPFADWPSLPEDVDHIRQLVTGKLGGSSGLWLLTESQLFFVHGLHGSHPERAEFQNISMELDVEVTEDSYVATKLDSSLYVFSSFNVTYMDCSLPDCEVTDVSCDLLPFETVLTSSYSLSDHTLWLGTTEGLFTVSHQDGCLTFSNVSEVEGAVSTLAWRSMITDGTTTRHPVSKSFFFDPTVENHLQEVFASSSRHGIQWTGSYWSRKKSEQDFGVLVVGTEERLYFYDGRKWWFEWVCAPEAGLGGLVDAVPTALTFGPSGELYVANNVSLLRVNINYTFDRIGPLEGLPYNQLTSLHVSPFSPSSPPLVGPAPPDSLVGTLWVGTAQGYTLFDIQSSKFVGYYNGPRWLPGGRVLDMAKSGPAVVLLTQQGLAVVYPESWTLAMKARHYEAMLERHTKPPGLVTDCALTNHTPSTCDPSDFHDNGMSTSWLVAAETFRYQVTENTAARDLAWDLFAGMKFLINVTSVPGLMACGVAMDNSSLPPHWHESLSVEGWRWLGDCPAAQVLAHMWAWPLVYDILAQEQEEKDEVVDIMRDIIDHVKNNQYQLLDAENNSAPWEVWSPYQLNLNQSWADKRGLNSLQILSFLLSAYRVTDDRQYLHAWKELFAGYYEDVPARYGLNIINQKGTLPLDTRPDDNKLAFLTYFLYYYSLQSMDKHQLADLGEEPGLFAGLSLRRAWHTVRRERGSAWTAIFAHITGSTHDEGLMKELIWNLRTWPLELIEWETHNSHRLDIAFSRDRQGNLKRTESVQVLPANERTQLHWDGNPFQLDSTGAEREVDPGPWLLPYWLARWSGML